MREFTTISVTPALTAEDLETSWEAERQLVNLPKLTFTPVDATHWRISFHPDHRDGGITNAVQQLRIAIHRQFPDRTIS